MPLSPSPDIDTPVSANLFAKEALAAQEPLDTLAEAFARLISTPEWAVYHDYIQRISVSTGMSFLKSGDPADAKEAQGYIRGLLAAVENAENLVRLVTAQQKQEEENELYRREMQEKRAKYIAVSARGR